MGKGGGGTTTITEIALPVYADDEAQLYVARAKHLAKSPNMELNFVYDQDTYASQNSNETDGITNLYNRGVAGSTTVDKARTVLDGVYDETKLNSHTKIDDLYTKEAALITRDFTEETLPSIEAEALSLGMYGSSGHAVRQAIAAESVKAKLNDLGRKLYYDDYTAERRRIAEHLYNVINVGHEGIRDGELVRQAGLYRREYTQGSLTDAFRAWVAEQEGEIKKLEVFSNAVRAIRGANIVKTEPYFRPSPMAQIAGLALAGAGMVAGFYGMRGGQPQQTNQMPIGGMARPTPQQDLNPTQANYLTQMAGNTFETGGNL